MIGSGPIADSLAAYLLAGLPDKLTQIRARFDPPLDPRVTPDPRQVLAHEPNSEGLDQLPAVYVTEVESTIEPHTSAAEGATYRTTNRIYILSVVAGRTHAETSRCRQVYTLAVRELLLENAGFAPNMRTMAKGMKEAHSEIEQRQSDRALMGACRTTVQVIAQEFLGNPAETVAPPHPAPMITVEVIS